MKDGGPAFPWDGDRQVGGMTLRQWYKGMALAGIRANPAADIASSDEMAKWAANDADALLREDEEASRE